MKEESYSIEKIKLIQKTIPRLWEELQREPLPEEVAAETGFAVEEVMELLNYKIEEEAEKDDFQLRFKMTVKNHELEKARMAKGWKQEEVAAKLGLGKATYGQIERCYEYPSYERMVAIAKLFGKPVKSLFPTWLEMFSRKWKEAEKERIVPINNFSLSSGDALGLPSGDDLEKIGQMAIAKNILGEALDDLTEREKGIIKHRFFDNETLEDTAWAFGVTRERIRQIEAKALEKLRENKKVEGLDDRTEREKREHYYRQKYGVQEKID